MSTVIYLAAAGLLWLPCVLLVGGNESSRLGRLAAGALLAAGWPLAVPLMVTALVLRRQQSRRRAALRVVSRTSVLPLLTEVTETVVAEL